MSHAEEPFDPSVSLTSALVELVSNKHVSESDFRWAALFTLDAIASIVGGSVDPSARPLLEWARAGALDTGRRALVYGGLSTVLELDDKQGHHRSREVAWRKTPGTSE